MLPLGTFLHNKLSEILLSKVKRELSRRIPVCLSCIVLFSEIDSNYCLTNFGHKNNHSQITFDRTVSIFVNILFVLIDKPSINSFQISWKIVNPNMTNNITHTFFISPLYTFQVKWTTLMQSCFEALFIKIRAGI